MLNKMKSAFGGKKIILTFLASMFITLGFSFPVLAKSDMAKGPAESATGGVGYNAAGLERRLEFNAHELSDEYDGKGMLRYSDANGDWYMVDIQYVNVDGDMAYFAGPVISASQPGWFGNWLSAAVKDGGEQAYMIDEVYGIFATEMTAMNNVINKVSPGSAYFVTDGNLQVHSMNIEE